MTKFMLVKYWSIHTYVIYVSQQNNYYRLAIEQAIKLLKKKNSGLIYYFPCLVLNYIVQYYAISI